jgi:hypothetical protein
VAGIFRELDGIGPARVASRKAVFSVPGSFEPATAFSI